jgi:hypothetical protein
MFKARVLFTLHCSALLLLSALPAHAIPPPPREPSLLREAKMAVTVQLVEASDGTVTRTTKLCEVRGKIPVYADNGSAASFYAREIAGCSMVRDGKNLPVYVRGAKAISKARITYATASVGVIPPDAVPLCSICGPQPLADSSAEIRATGTAKSLQFSLHPNPVSILNAKPTVWLEAEIEIVD